MLPAPACSSSCLRPARQSPGAHEVRNWRSRDTGYQRAQVAHDASRPSVNSAYPVVRSTPSVGDCDDQDALPSRRVNDTKRKPLDQASTGVLGAWCAVIRVDSCLCDRLRHGFLKAQTQFAPNAGVVRDLLNEFSLGFWKELKAGHERDVASWPEQPRLPELRPRPCRRLPAVALLQRPTRLRLRQVRPHEATPGAQPPDASVLPARAFSPAGRGDQLGLPWRRFRTKWGNQVYRASPHGARWPTLTPPPGTPAEWRPAAFACTPASGAPGSPARWPAPPPRRPSSPAPRR